MRKIKFVATILFVMLGVQASLAQASVSLGLKAGLNFANVNASTPATVYDSRTGYHAGAFVNIKLTKLAIQPEVIYSVQGSSVTVGGVNIDSELNYVNIPIILKLYLVGGFNLQAGPQFGFLASAVGPVVSGSTVVSGDIKNTLNSSDTSIALGAGFDIKKLTIDARYNLGISEVNNAAGSSATKNQVFQLSLGFKLFKFGS